MLRINLLGTTRFFQPLRDGEDETGGGAAPPPKDPKTPETPAEDGESNEEVVVEEATTDEEPEAAAATEEEEPEPEPAPAEPTWKDKELRRKHAQLKERDRRLAEVQAENESLRAIAARRGTAGEEEPEPTPTRAAPGTVTDVEAAAQRIVAKNQYTADCNAADAAAKKAYGKKWEEAASNLELLGGIEIDTMIGLLATDNPAKVLYTMGSNAEEYHRIMALPPAKRLNEMAKIAATPDPKPSKKPSNAPEPVDTINVRPAPVRGGLNDDLDDNTWFTRRRAEKRQKFLESQKRA